MLMQSQSLNLDGATWAVTEFALALGHPVPEVIPPAAPPVAPAQQPWSPQGPNVGNTYPTIVDSPSYGAAQPPYAQTPGYASSPPYAQTPGYASSPPYASTPPYSPAPPFGAAPPYQPVPAQPGGYQGYQYPPQPKKSNGGLIVGIVVVVILLLIGGGFGISALLGSHRKDTGTTTGNPSTGPHAIPIGDGTTLLSKVVAAPAGADVLTVDDSAGGVMDLDQFVQHYFSGDATERGRLETRGYKVCAVRDFIRKDGVEVATHIVQFATDDGANGYVAGQLSAYGDDNDVTGTFGLPSISNGKGFEKSALDSDGTRRTVMFAQLGNLAVVINVYTPGQLDRAGDVALMTAQVNLIGHA
jgi:hypothetical protein